MSAQTTTPPPPLDRFFNNLKFFAGDIHSLGTRLNKEGKVSISEIKLNAFYNYLIDPHEARNTFITFIQSSYPHWKSISERKEDFIGENLAKTLFPKLESSVASQILKLINDPALETDKKNMWDKITSFVKIGIMFTYLERAPITLGKENYRNPSFLPDINVVDGAKLFNMDLSRAF